MSKEEYSRKMLLNVHPGNLLKGASLVNQPADRGSRMIGFRVSEEVFESIGCETLSSQTDFIHDLLNNGQQLVKEKILAIIESMSLEALSAEELASSIRNLLEPDEHLGISTDKFNPAHAQMRLISVGELQVLRAAFATPIARRRLKSLNEDASDTYLDEGINIIHRIIDNR